jgi:hypothetical protein
MTIFNSSEGENIVLIAGWWFGTFFISHNIWDNPSHKLILFKMVKTTNQIVLFTTWDTVVPVNCAQ